MKQIGSFFEKIKKILSDGNANKKIIADAINFEIKGNISEKDIKIHNGVALILTSPVIKSEISIKKEKILSRVSDKIFLADIR
jgi:hypothetical protein